MWNSFPSGIFNESHVDNGTQIIYQWIVTNLQIIPLVACPYTMEAQFNLVGTVQPTSTDTYSFTSTTIAGLTSTFSGHF